MSHILNTVYCMVILSVIYKFRNIGKIHYFAVSEKIVNESMLYEC